MRAVRDPELERLKGRLGDMVRLARTAMSTATSALLDAEYASWGIVSATEVVPHALFEALEERSSAVFARERVSGTELRSVIADVQICTDVEHVVELARHVAEVARTRQAKQPLPARLVSVLGSMSGLVLRMLDAAGEFRGWQECRDDFQQDVDELARLRQLLYRGLLSGAGTVDVRTAVDVTLVGLYYERCADQAVSMARHVALLSGGAPER